MSTVSKQVSVDRVEGGLAVLLDGRQEIRVPTDWLPEGAGEGAWLRFEIAADPQAESAARARVEGLQSHLKRR
jgi:hypothetical protein